MSLHEELMATINREIESKGGATYVSPTALALAVQAGFMTGPVEPHLQYASLEHLKALSRSALRRYEHDDEESQSMQDDMFTGLLQDRYPIPREPGGEPVYKLREQLTDAEVDWNVTSLRKSAAARLEHADALAAWKKSRGESKAA